MSYSRSIRPAALLCAAFAATGGASIAAASPAGGSSGVFAPHQPLDVVLYDRTAGRPLPVYRHRGELHVAGEPGHEYEIRLRNRGADRVLAVTSVDGVNVVTGRTAATDQPGYVIADWSSASIDGWRKSLGEVASFVFTTPRRSYAARTGRPDDVGVIGIAMFREAPRPASPAPDAWGEPVRDEAAAGSAAERSAAPSAAPGTGAKSSAAARALGTGHGARHDSPVEQVRFERASDTPDAVLRIYYDSRERLVASGVIDPEPALARRRPEPFPGGFVPDP